MQVIQSPEIAFNTFEHPRLFLAGGISNCPDWQKELTESLLSKYDGKLDMINPRRIGDLCRDGEDAKIQIKWEIDMIEKSSYFIFWFPEETLCPITLFELGKIVQELHTSRFCGDGDNYICVGIHPNYTRKMDLEIQLPAIMKHINIVNSLNEIEEWIVNTFKLTTKI